MRKWAKITNQTPAAKLGYIGQHLASLITGVPGTSTGARGDDLADHSEVKSCNKVDQVDTCKDCGGRVMKMQDECPNCHSTNINRKADSKWLFSIRDKRELQQYEQLDRIFLLIFDYPRIKENLFNDIRIRAFELYPKEERMQVFCKLIENHFHNIYLPKAKKGDKTNPMNLHPDMFQFYMCNPVKTYECIIKDVDTEPKFDTRLFIAPNVERDMSINSELMPSELLSLKELQAMIKAADYQQDIVPLLTAVITKKKLLKLCKKEIVAVLPYIDENLRQYIPLRDIISIKQHTPYQRVKTSHS